MKKLSTLVSLFLALCLILGLAACGGGDTDTPDDTDTGEADGDTASSTDNPYPALPDDGDTYTITIGTSGTEDSVNFNSCSVVKELLETYSDGKFEVSVYPNNQLGTERETLEGGQTGNITMTLVSTSVVVPFIPECGLFDLPRLFTSSEIALEVLNEGSLSAKLTELHEEQGFKLMGYYPNAYRQMSSNIPVYTMEDFAGIRVRTMENEYQMAFFTAIGATPMPLAVTEVYTALQQGLVDATENPYNSFHALGWHEQQQYIIEYDSNMFVAEYVMNKDFYDSLPVEYQEFLDAVMEDVIVQSAEIGREFDDEYKQILIDYGCEIIEFTDEQKDELRAASESVYDLARTNLGDEIVDLALDSVAAVS